MNGKLLIICACCAFASAASVAGYNDNNHLAFETDEAYYVPISAVEAESLGLPPQLDLAAAASSSRRKRELPAAESFFETDEAYYIPISDEEAQALRLPRSIAESELIFVTDEETDLESAAEAGRSKRQLKIQGGGSPKQGVDISAQARAKLWESKNGRNSLHGTAQYSQHLGGPYGNSRPNVGGGLTFTRRF